MTGREVPLDDQRWWPTLAGRSKFSDAHEGRAADDPRNPYERDRDRLLYTDEFERLRGVTQVVSPTEGILCHDRHSHSLRVEQLAMRMTQNPTLLKTRPRGAPDDEPDLWVVAAAALAHDLGHPPFGHVAEQELDRLLRHESIGDRDGFEGNAQSFRIITRLAAHREEGQGLRLTRRVLRATLKYPWLSDSQPATVGKRKYGAYGSDAEAFRFATAAPGHESRASRSIEAAIMDAADAITYSVHDLLDFYRAGLIELGRLEDSHGGAHGHDDKTEPASSSDVAAALGRLLTLFKGWPRYDDSRESRADVQRLTSQLITTLLAQHELKWTDQDGWSLEARPEAAYVMNFLQGLTRRYVIDSDTLAVTQVGHRRVVRRLFRLYIRSLLEKEYRIFPALFRDEAEQLGAEISAIISQPRNNDVESDGGTDPSDPIQRVPRELRVRAARLSADVVASLTDRQALSLNLRVTGLLPQDGFAGQRDS